VTLIPLFPHDGYYLLITWLEIPDLRNRARALARSWILRRPLPEPLTSREIRGFKWYGVLSVGFEVILWGLILGLAGDLLTRSMKGIGAMLFLVLLYLRFEHTLKRQWRRMWYRRPLLMNQSGAPKTVRRLIQVALLTAIVLIMFVPYPFTVGGDFRLLPVHQLGIRAQVSGEIKSVLVKEGQWVKEGQPVALLLGRDQEKKVEEIKAALDETRARLSLLKEGPKPEEIAKAKQEVKTAAKSLKYSQLQADRYANMFKNKAVSEKDYENALRKRDLDRERLELTKRNLELVKSGARDEEIEALEAEVRRLEVDLAHAQEDLRLTTLVSPADGKIITPYLSQTVGQFLGVGDLFAVVEDATSIMAEIRVPEEDAGEVRIGSRVKLKTWTYPNTSFMGNVVAIAPVAYEKSRRRVERTLSEREWRFEQEEILREKGKVVRVLSELSNSDGLLKTDMTGYAKIECEWKPLVVAFTRWLVRFFLIEVWSWIPGFLW
jgi:multidrug resistance efflux pump